jgi:hypothetical protein
MVCEWPAAAAAARAGRGMDEQTAALLLLQRKVKRKSGVEFPEGKTPKLRRFRRKPRRGQPEGLYPLVPGIHSPSNPRFSNPCVFRMRAAVCIRVRRSAPIPNNLRGCRFAQGFAHVGIYSDYSRLDTNYRVL